MTSTSGDSEPSRNRLLARSHTGHRRSPRLEPATSPPANQSRPRKGSTSVESTVETLSPTRVRLAIEVPFAELEPSLKKAYREIGAQVTIPGFRKGKVPNAIIDQRIGRSVVLDEAKNDVIRAQTEQAIRDHRVRRLGPAEVEVTDFSDGQPLKFTAELDVRPEITLPNLGELQIQVDAIAVTDEDVDAQLDGLRQ